MSDPRQLPATPIARTRTAHRRGTAASDHLPLLLHSAPPPSLSNRTTAASRSGPRSAHWSQPGGSSSHISAPRTKYPPDSTTPSRPRGLPPRPPAAHPSASGVQVDSDPDLTPRKTDNFPTPPAFNPALTRSCQNLRAQTKWRRKSEQLPHPPSVAHRHSLSEAFFNGYESNSSSGSGSSMSEELARRRSGRASTSTVPSSPGRVSSRASRLAPSTSSDLSARPSSSLARSSRPRRSDLHEQEVREIRSQSRAGFARGTDDDEDDNGGPLQQKVAPQTSSPLSRSARERTRTRSPSSLATETAKASLATKSPVTSPPSSVADDEVPTRRRTLAARRRTYASELDSSSDTPHAQRYLPHILADSSSSKTLHLRTSSSPRMNFNPLPRPITSVGVRAYSRAGSVTGGDADFHRGPVPSQRSDAPLSPSELARIRKISSLSAESAPPSSYKLGTARSDIFSGNSALSPSTSERLKLLQGRREALQRLSKESAGTNGSPASGTSVKDAGGIAAQADRRPPSRSASVAGASSLYRSPRERAGSMTNSAQFSEPRRRSTHYAASEVGGDRSRSIINTSDSTRQNRIPATPTARAAMSGTASAMSGSRSHSRFAASARHPLPSSSSAPVLAQQDLDKVSAPERNMLVSFDLFERHFAKTRVLPTSPSTAQAQQPPASSLDLVEKSRQFVETVSTLNGGIRELAQQAIQREIEAEMRGDSEGVAMLREMDSMLAQLLKHSDKQMRGMGDLLSAMIRVDKDAVKGGIESFDAVSSRADSRLGTASSVSAREEVGRNQATPVSSGTHGEQMRKSATLGHSSGSRADRWHGHSVPAKLRREQRDIRLIADSLRGTPGRPYSQNRRNGDSASPALLADQSTSFEGDDSIDRSPSLSYTQRRRQSGSHYRDINQSRSQTALARYFPGEATSSSSPTLQRKELPMMRRDSVSTLGRPNGITGLSPRLPRLSHPSVDTATAVARLDAAQLDKSGHNRRSTVDMVGNDQARNTSPTSFSSEAETLRHRMRSGGTDSEGNTTSRSAYEADYSSTNMSPSKSVAPPPRPPKASRRSQTDLRSSSKTGHVRGADIGGDAASPDAQTDALNGGLATSGTAIIQPVTGEARIALKMVEKTWSERQPEGV
ncbi:hypothetical protein BCV69DRAFT_301759 [Microstroma glucosiphilum]|uniref:Uncharacterized protein n=1 Tax=Pseudomicrostroma glucosiphilum TaxID=1684307 RepID=A0A316TY66_9BASI|nr:hypothetical protein BCV69DRAFT_301759 [Pseudomicrostroma glucosiphilum]PWN18020.1 hypothetical protein BCV69DRAFT_301759 [Pseudomicrostroma glucosiphilum]